LKLFSAKVGLPKEYSVAGKLGRKKRRLTLYDVWGIFMEKIEKTDTVAGKLCLNMEKNEISVLYSRDDNKKKKESLKTTLADLLLFLKHNSPATLVIPKYITLSQLRTIESLLLELLKSSKKGFNLLGRNHYLKTIFLNKELARAVKEKECLIIATNSRETSFPVSIDYFGLKIVETPADLEVVKQTMTELGRIFMIE